MSVFGWSYPAGCSGTPFDECPDDSCCSFCGQPLPDAPREEEPLFGCTSCTTEDKLLIEVAREFCIDPVLLDDMMIAADHAEQERQVARALATAGVCAYWMRGLECRNAPITKPGTCGCRGAH